MAYWGMRLIRFMHGLMVEKLEYNSLTVKTV